MSGGNVARRKINQDDHEFSVLEVVRWNAGAANWEKAQADTPSILRGLVITVETDHRFVMVDEGRTKYPDHGLTVGSTYYIDSQAAGQLVEGEPIGALGVEGQLDPLLFVGDAQTLFVFPSVGGASAYARAFDHGELSNPGRDLTVNHNLNTKALHVTVRDYLNDIQPPDSVTFNDENTITINLATYVVPPPPAKALQGIWNVTVSK